MKSNYSCIAILFFFFVPLLLSADTPTSKGRKVTQLADGIYEIRHKNPPDHFTQGNTVVIIGDNGVLVVDSCYLPSSAREDIAQIRQWTTKPVRYLLNTHWHNDHTQGNSVYADAFPDITIISQTETAKMMPRISGFLSRYPHRMEIFQQEIDSGKDLDGNPLSKEAIDDLKVAVMGGKEASDAVSAEFRNLRVKLPDVTFSDEMDVNLGNREVQLKYLGKGNTTGDAIAYLPKEKIVIVGDLVDSPVPIFESGYPLEQTETLRKLLQLDFDTLVPGHGEVLKGKEYVQQELAFLEEVIKAVDKEIGVVRGKMHDARTSFDQIKKGVEQDVDVKAWRQKFAGNDESEQDFFDAATWPGLITIVHAELWPR